MRNHTQNIDLTPSPSPRGEGGKSYPFGSNMMEYKNADFSYSFDFNGKETDSETGLQDYGMRIYNKAYGKFLSVDPLAPDYPYFTPYQFASNSVIWNIDIDGLEGTPATTGAFRRDIANAPPSPGGVPYIVYEYERRSGVLYRRNHYKNVDPRSRGFRNLQDPNRNQWHVVTDSPRGNVLWCSLAGHNWEARPVTRVVNAVMVTNSLASGIFPSNTTPTVGPVVTVIGNVVGVINAQILIANANAALLNNRVNGLPNMVIGPPVVGGNEAPGANSTTTTTTQTDNIVTAVNVNFSVTMFVQANNPFFQNMADQIQAQTGLPVNIVEDPTFNSGPGVSGTAFNPATDFDFQINYDQNVTNTQTQTVTQETSSNYTPPNSPAQPGNP